MALGSLNLRGSKEEFEKRISVVDIRMGMLADVINRYNDAKKNLDQFMEGNDSNYQAMLERVEKNLETAKKAHAALQETKASLQDTVSKMENVGSEIRETIQSGTEATASAVKAALKIESIL